MVQRALACRDNNIITLQNIILDINVVHGVDRVQY